MSLRQRARACGTALPRLVGLVPALALVLHAGPATASYDCNIHFNRTINGATTNYRDVCRNASPSAGEFPVCVCNNTGAVTASASVTACPAGTTEVGRCKQSGEWYRTCSQCSSGATGSCVSGTCLGGCGMQGAYCASAANHHSFVPTPSECDAPAHEVLSAVEGCRALCDRYFATRYYDQNDTAQSAVGSWRIGEHPTIPNLGDIIVDPGNNLTALAACNRTCGPPNPFDPTPPFGIDQDNHWHFVNFARHNPNASLGGWLRSYAVNKDKPDSPAGNCQTYVNAYCELPTVTSAPNVSGKRVQCKKNLLIFQNLYPSYLPGEVDFRAATAFDFSSETTFNLGNDGFCDHFFRANNLATNTCYQRSDGAKNFAHYCGSASTGPCFNGELGGACNECSDSIAVCPTGFPPPTYAQSTIVVPAKSTTCGVPTVVTGGSTIVDAGYGAGAAQVVGASWKNLTPGCTGLCEGPLVFTPYGWLSADDAGTIANASLVVGQVNRVRVKFVDAELRVSGDMIDIAAQ